MRARRSLTFFVVAALTLAGAGAAAAAPVVGLTGDDKLIAFDTLAPSTLISGPTPIAGLPSGETLVGIDVRPATGQLYGVGRTGHLYLVGVDCATATAVGTGTFVTPLSGSEVGVGFNPTVDRIRMVDNAQHNFRAHPVTSDQVDGDTNTAGIQADTSLAYEAGDPNFGQTPSISAISYDNNFAGATITTLYGIDTGLDILVNIGGVNGSPSPNGGKVFTRGSLGLNATGTSGFDIRANGTPLAFAALQTGGAGSSLYSINLATGAATVVGSIGSGTFAVRDIAVDAPLPGACGLPSPADTTGPELLIDVERALALKKASKGIPFGYSCDEGCTVTATLTAKGDTLGSTSTSLGQAGTGSGKIGISKDGKKALKKVKKKLKATLTLSATDGAGNASALSRKLTLGR